MYKLDTIFAQPIITNAKSVKFYHNFFPAGYVDAGNKQTMHNKETLIKWKHATKVPQSHEVWTTTFLFFSKTNTSKDAYEII